MRAYEFISEAKKKGKKPKMHDWHEGPSTGSYRFMDDGTDRIYHLNRIMMAAAMADGKSTKPVDSAIVSFAGKNNMAYPYSEIEHNMMKQAFNTVSPHTGTTLVGDHRSLEPKDTHKTSPVTSFKGFE
jgi:hypothetical protein